MLAQLQWARNLHVSPLMHWATAVRGLMWKFDHMKSGATLSFGKLWAGCSSFKRDFALRAGGYTTELKWAEDTDLELRMKRLGLSVIYNQNAVSYVTKSIRLHDVIRRAKHTGNAIAVQWCLQVCYCCVA